MKHYENYENVTMVFISGDKWSRRTTEEKFLKEKEDKFLNEVISRMKKEERNYLIYLKGDRIELDINSVNDIASKLNFKVISDSDFDSGKLDVNDGHNYIEVSPDILFGLKDISFERKILEDMNLYVVTYILKPIACGITFSKMCFRKRFEVDVDDITTHGSAELEEFKKSLNEKVTFKFCLTEAEIKTFRAWSTFCHLEDNLEEKVSKIISHREVGLEDKDLFLMLESIKGLFKDTYRLKEGEVNESN